MTILLTIVITSISLESFLKMFEVIVIYKKEDTFDHCQNKVCWCWRRPVNKVLPTNNIFCINKTKKSFSNFMTQCM